MRSLTFTRALHTLVKRLFALHDLFIKSITNSLYIIVFFAYAIVQLKIIHNHFFNQLEIMPNRKQRVSIKISDETHSRLLAIQECTRDNDKGSVKSLPTIVAELIDR